MTDAQRLKVLLICYGESSECADESKACFIRELLQTSPNDESFALEYAEEFSAGLDILAKSDIDVVLLELELPGNQGLDAYHRINAQAPHTPVLFVAREDDETIRRKAFREGVQDFLFKDELDPPRLHRRIHNAIERQRANENLLISKTAQTLLDASEDMAVLLDAEGNFLWLNEATAKSLDTTVEKLLHRCSYDFASPEVAKLHKARQEELFRTKKPMHVEDEREGRSFYASMIPIFNEQGDVECMAAFVRDITELKQAEEALRESGVKHRGYIDNAPDGIFIIDATGRYREVNQAACELTGFTEDELLSMNIVELVPPEETARVRESFEELLERGATRSELQLRRKDGGAVPVILDAVRVSEDRLIGFCKNITERKQAEEALHKSEEKYRNLFTNMPVGLFWARVQDGKFLECNDSFAKMVGYDSREECLKDFLGSEHWADPADRQLMYQKIEENGKVEDFEAQLTRKDGSPFWASFSARIYLERKIIEGAIVDISERKQAEEHRRRTIQTLLDASSDSAFLVDTEGVFLAMNKATAERLNSTVDDLLHQCAFDFYPAEVAATRKASLDELFHTKKPIQFEDERDGIFYFTSMVPVLNELGEVDCAAVFARDISDRLEKENAANLLNAVVNASADAITGSTIDGVATSWNKGAEQIFGHKAEDVIGKSIFPFIQLDADTAFKELKPRLERGETIQKYEVENKKPGGRSQSLSHTISPIIDNSGCVIGVSVVTRDVSAHKQTEKRQNLTAKIMDLLNRSLEDEDSIPQIVTLLKEFTGIDAIGLRLRKGTSFPYYFTGGFPDDFFNAEKSFSSFDCIDLAMPEQCPAGGIPGDFLCARVLRKDLPKKGPQFTDHGSFWTNRMTEFLGSQAGKSFQVCSRGRCYVEGYELNARIPLRIEGEEIGLLQLNGKQPGALSEELILFLEEISISISIALKRQQGADRLRRANEELEQTVQQRTAELNKALQTAQSANQAKSEFLAQVGHEIRTPLNGIIPVLDWLKRTGLSEKQQAFVCSAQESGHDLARIINDLLDISKAEAGALELENEDFELYDCIERTHTLLAPKIAEKGLEQIVAINPDIPRWVKGDPLRFRQVLNNLLSNALKYTERGEIITRVSLKQRTPKGCVLEIEVEDTGIGIPPGRTADIFKPFIRLEPAARRKHKGAGLGLKITQHLVDLMGGHIEVQSKPGQGSVFRFTVAFNEATVTEEQWENQLKEALSGMRVLVAEGNKTCRETLAEQLTARGCEAQTAEDIFQAIQILEEAFSAENEFQVMLVSQNFSAMNEVEIAGIIKANSRIKDIPLLLMAPQEVSAAREKNLRNMGYEKCLTKPVRISILVNRLAKMSSPQEFMDLDTRDTSLKRYSLPENTRAQYRVLLVEDNRINQQAVSLLLDDMGVTCDLADHGREALNALKLREYDVVLMDCQMPEMDGYEATREIRRREQAAGDQATKRLPIIALTAEALSDSSKWCREAGMDGFLRKPVEEDDLFAALQQYLPLEVREWGGSGWDTRTPVELDDEIDFVPPAAKETIDDDSFATKMARFGPEKREELVNAFLENKAKILMELEEAIQERDYEMIASLAHSTKGGSLQFGANQLASIASNIEQFAKAEDFNRLIILQGTYEKEIERLREHLSKSSDASIPPAHDSSFPPPS